MNTRARSLSLPFAVLTVAAGCTSNRSSTPERGSDPGAKSRDEKKAESRDAEAPQSETVEIAPVAGVAPDDRLSGSGIVAGEPMIDGGLSRDIIRRKAQDHEADLRKCQELALEPELGRTIAFEFEIDARGIVTDVEVGEGSGFEDTKVVDCILEQIAKWSFAADVTGAAKVELQLDLSKR